MTLIVGAICKNGIVAASDSQVTMGGIKKRGERKIKQYGFCLWSGAGHVSEVQAIEKKLKKFSVEIKERGSFDKVASAIKQSIHEQRKHTVARYVDIYRSIDPSKIPFCRALLCGYDSNSKPRIGIVTQDGGLEESKDYAAIGIGTPFAQVLLKNLSLNNLIGNITIEEGKVFLYKVLREVIETGAYGMDFPVFIWEIKLDNTQNPPVPVLKEFSSEKGKGLDGVKETVDLWDRLEQEIFLKLEEVKKNTESKKKKQESNNE